MFQHDNNNNFHIHIDRKSELQSACPVLTSKHVLRSNLGNKYLLWCCSLTKSRAANIPQAENIREREPVRKKRRNDDSERERERAA